MNLEELERRGQHENNQEVREKKMHSSKSQTVEKVGGWQQEEGKIQEVRQREEKGTR